MRFFGRKNKIPEGSDGHGSSGKDSKSVAQVDSSHTTKKGGATASSGTTASPSIVYVVDADKSVGKARRQSGDSMVSIDELQFSSAGMHPSQTSSSLSLDTSHYHREPTPQNFLSGSRFECKEYINRGAFSFVVMAVDSSTQKKYALKFIPLQATKSKYIEREILNQFKLKHPHIIKLEEFFVTEEHLVLVLEYADKGDLFSYVRKRGPLREDSARWFFQQIILAIDFCHRMGVVNRDIKLENILLSSIASGKSSRKRIAKLSDFGFSKDETRHSAPNTRLGTVMYIAPEIMTNKANNSYDARKTDVWSAGVALYVMLAGQYPFLPDSDPSSDSGEEFGVKKMRDLLNRTVGNEFEKPQGVSDECHALLLRMLEPDPSKRMSVSDVMKNAWFMKGLSPDIAHFNDKVVAQLKKHPRVTENTVASVRRILNCDAKLDIASGVANGAVTTDSGI